MVSSDFSLNMHFSRNYMLKFSNSQYYVIFALKYLLIYIFIGINVVPQIHIIGRSLVPYTNLLSSTANLTEKLHLSSCVDIAMLLMWCLTIQSFRVFISQIIGRGSFCFVYGDFVLLRLRIRGLPYNWNFSKFHRYEIIENA